MQEPPQLMQSTRLLLAGISRTMSLSSDGTPDLFRAFMPQRRLLRDSVLDAVYLATEYPPGYFHSFDRSRTFSRWAAMEVTGESALPAGFSLLEVPAGLYAVFTHRGPHTDFSTFRHIFETWLPASGYRVDSRPHLDRMGPGYRHGAADSEETIWIPVCR